MAKTQPEADERFEQNLVIAAPPAVVFDCFFNADALRAWWQVVRSVTTPVAFGVYAIEWAPTEYLRRPSRLSSQAGCGAGRRPDAR